METQFVRSLIEGDRDGDTTHKAKNIYVDGGMERANEELQALYNITNVHHPEKCILKYAILCMYNDTPKIVICK